MHIEGNSISYCDGAFCGIVDKIGDVFQEKADEWRHSKFGNYDNFTTEQREEIARRWEKAKDLPDGEYDYYFNLENMVEVFKKSVDELAKKFGIDYELKLK